MELDVNRFASSSVKLAALTVAAGLMAGCLSFPEDRAFDPRAAGDNERNAARDLSAARPIDLPSELDRTYFSRDVAELRRKAASEPLLEPLSTTPRPVKLDLRSAIQRAVVGNLDVRVASYSPGIEEARVVEAEARFDPTFFSSLQYEVRDSLSPGVSFFGNGPGGLTIDRQDNFTGTVGIRQLLESGGELRLQYQTQAIDFRTTGASDFGPTWLNEASVQLTQPLLRDFGRETNRARIVINRNNQHISLLDFRTTLETQLFELEQLYWQLVQAQREVEIQQELLQQTLDTVVILAGRQNQDVTLVQLSQANSSLETRRAQLVRAKARVASVGDQIKQKMNDPQLPVGGAELLLPDTMPTLQQVIFDPQEQIVTGLANRAEIAQQAKRIESALVTLQVAKNNALPRLDLILEGALQGAKDEFFKALGEQVDANDDIFARGAVGVQIEVPLGNRANRAIFRRVQLQHWQAIAGYERIVQQVTLDVKESLRELNTTFEEIQRTRASKFAAAEALRALQIRQDNDEPLTPQFVDQKLRQQELLAQAARDEAAAVTNYNIALARLERAKGTLLQYNNVILDEDAVQSGR